ncbi:MAG: hypothetical protein N2595_06375 [bacterium]|nr:hypothetical protein [bacterium]
MKSGGVRGDFRGARREIIESRNFWSETVRWGRAIFNAEEVGSGGGWGYKEEFLLIADGG